ncbi:MAG: TlpA family protein disulfide reductase [Endomicrobia bacterium]|nr:TlpA family protein disulfide reductase [Endomicrobiia bacterium]
MKKIIVMLILLTVGNIYSQTKKVYKETVKYIDFEAQQIVSTDTFKLSSIVGKKLILINFWTTWCPYCVEEIPHLINLYNKYKDNGLEILAINIGEPKNKVENFVISEKIPYKILLDTQGKIARQYGVRGIPTNFLISPEGNIIFAGHSLPNFELIEKNFPKVRQSIEKKKKK